MFLSPHFCSQPSLSQSETDEIPFTAIPCNSAAKLDDLIRIKLVLRFLLVRESRELCIANQN